MGSIPNTQATLRDGRPLQHSSPLLVEWLSTAAALAWMRRNLFSKTAMTAAFVAKGVFDEQQ